MPVRGAGLEVSGAAIGVQVRGPARVGYTPDRILRSSDLDWRPEMQPEEGGFLVRRDGSGHRERNPLRIGAQVYGAAPSGRLHFIPGAAGAAPGIFIVGG